MDNLFFKILKDQGLEDEDIRAIFSFLCKALPDEEEQKGNNKRYMLIVHGKGSGKTTFCKFLSHMFAVDALGAFDGRNKEIDQWLDCYVDGKNPLIVADVAPDCMKKFFAFWRLTSNIEFLTVPFQIVFSAAETDSTIGRQLISEDCTHAFKSLLDSLKLCPREPTERLKQDLAFHFKPVLSP